MEGKEKVEFLWFLVLWGEGCGKKEGKGLLRDRERRGGKKQFREMKE